MLLSVIGIVAGLILLTYSADHFVLGATRISARLRLSTVVIGAVVIGFGTSAPEMVVSGIASGQGLLDIAAGNIIGSNVANLSLVLGAAALVTPIAVASPTLRREAPIAMGATLVFALLVQDGFTRVEGAVLALALAAALAWILRGARTEDRELSDEVDEYLEGVESSTMRSDGIRTALGLLGTLIAAQVLVTSARSIAESLGLAQGFVGLTVVAIGTSLPELATSIQAARKGETDLVVGNLLGSNIFNSLGVSAVAGLIGPGLLQDAKLTGLAVVLMIAVSLIAAGFMATGRHVVRWEGAALLIGYLLVLPALAG